ncbi:MAG: cytochrome C, partial [Bacteroidota bacterium]
QLDGISNCTQCHILGEQLSNDKCLACHAELKERIAINKGYHSSAEVKGKTCASCHSDHQGKSFKIVKFETETFNHNITGFILSGAHGKKTCTDCHNAKFISNAKVKTKKFTFLGLKTNCVNCHTDYHKGTLSSNCLNCHDGNAFKPASKFKHTSAKFQLTGKHENVDCIKCHKIETINGVKSQKFIGLQYNTCSNCHIDPHENKFGPNCMECHSNASFVVTKAIKGFDHTKTSYNLEGKHLILECKSCHKAGYGTPIKHQNAMIVIKIFIMDSLLRMA